MKLVNWFKKLRKSSKVRENPLLQLSDLEQALMHSFMEQPNEWDVSSEPEAVLKARRREGHVTIRSRVNREFATAWSDPGAVYFRNDFSEMWHEKVYTRWHAEHQKREKERVLAHTNRLRETMGLELVETPSQ